MTTHPGSDALHAYLDGELDADGRRAVDAHLELCPSCREALGELAEVATAVRALPGEATPPRDLWPGIEGRLAPRAAAAAEGRVAGRGRWRRVSLSMPQLYAAGIALALASGSLAWWAAGAVARGPGVPGGPDAAAPAPTWAVPEPLGAARPAGTAEERYDRAVAELEAVLEEGRDLLDPETVATLEASLAAVDRAIAEARAALARDPGSDLLNRLLESHRETRLRILEQAVVGMGRT